MTEASISTEIAGPCLIVRLGDEFMVFPDQFDPVDAAVATVIESDADAKALRFVIMDCQHVVHLSSASLGKLVALHKSLDRGDRQLRICGLNDHLKEIMRATQLDTFFSIFDEQVAATTIGD